MSAVPPITSVRYKVLWLTVLLYAITYMDRVCIYAAMPVIAKEFSFDKLTQGLIFSAFAWGYSSLQVPSGWLVDRIGPRRMLSGIVLWWSAFTMFTVSAWNAASFVVIRFLFGAGEAGAFPSATRAFSRWLATSERGFAQGVTHSGSRLAGALTHGVVAAMIVVWGWRLPFLLFGVIGILWSVFWFFWYRDRPEDHAGVSASELKWINDGKIGGGQKKSVLSWKKLLAHPNMWYVCVMYFCYGYVLVDLSQLAPHLFCRGSRLWSGEIRHLHDDSTACRNGDELPGRLVLRPTLCADRQPVVQPPAGGNHRLCNRGGVRDRGRFGARCNFGSARHVGGGGRTGTYHRSVVGGSSGYRARSFRNGFGCHEHVWELGRSYFAASGGLAGPAI